MSEKENQVPSWDKISNLANKLDEAVDEGILKLGMNFLEIEVALLMVKEKIDHEKYRILAQMYRDENLHGNDRKPPANFYR